MENIYECTHWDDKQPQSTLDSTDGWTNDGCSSIIRVELNSEPKQLQSPKCVHRERKKKCGYEHGIESSCNPACTSQLTRGNYEFVSLHMCFFSKVIYSSGREQKYEIDF